mgnify:CR=1 FL=1
MLNIAERYKPIEGYNEYYITESGKVYAYRTRPVGWQGLRELKAKGRMNPKRYLMVALSANGHVKYCQIHTLVAKAFCDGYFTGAVVHHKDGNIHNNHYTNLEWTTQKENVYHSYMTCDQTRNYHFYNLIDPDGRCIAQFKGRPAVKTYIIRHKINTSYLSLVRHGVSRGWKLVKIPEAVTTIS